MGFDFLGHPVVPKMSWADVFGHDPLNEPWENDLEKTRHINCPLLYQVTVSDGMKLRHIR